jgi:hypothetical protein
LRLPLLQRQLQIVPKTRAAMQAAAIQHAARQVAVMQAAAQPNNAAMLAATNFCNLSNKTASLPYTTGQFFYSYFPFTNFLP